MRWFSAGEEAGRGMGSVIGQLPEPNLHILKETYTFPKIHQILSKKARWAILKENEKLTQGLYSGLVFLSHLTPLARCISGFMEDQQGAFWGCLIFRGSCVLPGVPGMNR